MIYEKIFSRVSSECSRKLWHWLDYKRHDDDNYDDDEEEEDGDSSGLT